MRQDITISDGTVVHTLDAFPFDSSPNLVTTEQGYRRGDRAVDAWTMQRTFRQFFSDGVFGTPSDAFQIGKAESGLAVTIQPGMAIIQGAMGGIKEDDGALTVTLDTEAAAGNICYGIMLRYDNNSDVRSLGIRSVKGVAESNPQPPEPDTTSAGVKEIRLGYVTVPNGAINLANATVTNEKGSSVCPYAAPFVPLDTDAIYADADASVQESLLNFNQLLSTYYGLLQSAVDGTTAGNLQNQINDLAENELSDSVDNVTIKYAPTSTSGGVDKLQVVDGSINRQKIDEAVFTDSASSHATASDKIAATPACVDAKISQDVAPFYSFNGNAIVGERKYFNFNQSGVVNSGFTIGSNYISIDKNCTLTMNLTGTPPSGMDSSGWLVSIGSATYTINSSTAYIAASYTAGDHITIKNNSDTASSKGTINSLLMIGI